MGFTISTFQNLIPFDVNVIKLKFIIIIVNVIRLTFIVINVKPVDKYICSYSNINPSNFFAALSVSKRCTGRTDCTVQR